MDALVSELGVGPGGELELTATHPPQPPRDTMEKAKAQNKGKSPQGVVDKPVADPSLPMGKSSLPSHYTMPSAFTVQVQSGELPSAASGYTGTCSAAGGDRNMLCNRAASTTYVHTHIQSATVHPQLLSSVAVRSPGWVLSSAAGSLLLPSPGGSTREVLVVVEKAAATKSFLGGYRHRTSGVEYHHCACQTAPRRRVDPTGVERAERETQTMVSRNTQQQTLAEAATQMVGADGPCWHAVCPTGRTCHLLPPRPAQGAMPATSLTRCCMLEHTRLPTSIMPGGGRP